MSKWSKYNKKPKKKPRTDEAFTALKVYIPKKTEEILRLVSIERGIPMSRLAAIAIDNELDVNTPFYYPCDIPETEYKEYAFAKESKFILDWISKFPKGIGIDSLVLCRRDLGIKSRDVILEALRELLEKDICALVNPPMAALNRAYQKIRVKDDARDTLAGKQRFTRDEFGKPLKNKKTDTDDNYEVSND